MAQGQSSQRLALEIRETVQASARMVISLAEANHSLPDLCTCVLAIHSLVSLNTCTEDMY